MWLSGWKYGEGVAPYGILVMAALVAALLDARSRRIPNALTLPLLAAGAAWSVWAHGSLGLLGAAVSAFVLALPCLLLFLLADGGAGDVKLLAALGAWVAPGDAVELLAGVAVAAVICGLITAHLRGRLASVLGNVRTILGGLVLAVGMRRATDARLMMPSQQQMETMPFGISIAMGVCMTAVARWLWI